MQTTDEMDNHIDKTTRPVNVNTWIHRSKIQSNGFTKTATERQFLYSGRCHGFSHESDGETTTVVAIVEKFDGTVDTPSANCIQFTDV